MFITAIFVSKVPEYLVDSRDDPRWMNRRFLQELGLRGYAGIPLMIGGRALGVLAGLFGEPHEFTAEEKELLNLLARLFDDAGYQVLAAGTGKNGLDLGLSEKPALAVIDLLLPDMMGYHLAEALRAAGDTFWTAAARLVLAWVIFTPGGVLVVITLDGGPEGAMLCVIGYLALLAGAFAYRFRSGAWKKIELLEPTLA